MNLSSDQQKAISHIEGPALVLAVPGAGKTTVLIQRTMNLIKNENINPKRILSITFSRASARDMSNRFLESFPESSRLEVSFSTIHSFCFALIREYAFMTNTKYTLIEDSRNKINKFNLIRDIYSKVNKEYITEEKLESTLNYIGYIKNMMITVDEFLKFKKIEIDNFKEIYNTYEKYKKANNLIDFDDMLTKSLDILNKDKYLLGKYRSKFDFIQVDEGQDVSKAQMEIIKLISYPKNNLFIVADDDQSIYGFRGADPKGLFKFNQYYPEGKLFFMEDNYRSSKNIVSVCSKFIKLNTIRYDKNIKTTNEYIEPINLIKTNSINEQYDYILKDIENYNLSNCCILYRNNLSSIGIINFFERNNIPFYMRDIKVRFFNHWIVRDILDFIVFSQDTSKLSIYENIFYKKRGYISRKQINYAGTLNYKESVFDRIMDFPGLPSYYKYTLRDLKLSFKKLSNMNPKDAIEYIQYNLEYDEYLKENAMKFGHTYNNLRTILYLLKEIAKECENFIEFNNRLKSLERLCTNSRNINEGITLSTIHSAKGLEFERVYMVDLIDGDFPSSSSIEANDKNDHHLLEEERRLFYVGMTRAKKHLSLISPKYINNDRAIASRFLTDLSKNF